MPLIDTLTLKTGLLDGGMPEPQADAIVRALAHADTEQLATKADLEVLRADLNAKFEELRADLNIKMEALRADLNTKMEALRREMSSETEALRADLNTKMETLRREMGSETEALRRDLSAETGALRGDFKALNGKVNLILAFNTPLVLAVLALLWRLFFAGQGAG